MTGAAANLSAVNLRDGKDATGAWQFHIPYSFNAPLARCSGAHNPISIEFEY